MAKKTKQNKKQRQERRFVSQSGTSSRVAWIVGWIAGLVLGAGAFAYVFAHSFAEDEKMRSLPSYLVAAGAVLLGAAIWLGSSNEPPVRVGDPGVALEKGDLRRMPWWTVEKISFDGAALVLLGMDETNVDWTLKLPLRAHRDAIAWILKEARERIPKRVDVGDLAVPPAENAGQKLELEALQVVGKRCAATGKTISYEPDARVCPRCERVYAKDSVPKKCKCGNSLSHLQPKDKSGESVKTEAASEEAS